MIAGLLLKRFCYHIIGFPASRSIEDILHIAGKYLLRIKLDRFGMDLRKLIR
ncbi:MAG: hypothetical protein JRF49_12285 [Deltaproteobacteria bacterium]|nr:hypothetical protein [Deltaproteobacteria bacterium]